MPDDKNMNGDGTEDSDEDMPPEFEGAELEKIKAALVENQYDYDAHLRMIEHCRTCGELDHTRNAYEAMSALFPLAPKMWLKWIEMEQGISDGKDKETTRKLYERAISDYPQMDVWSEYCNWAIGALGSDPQLVREVFERAVNSVGYHVSQGCLLWDTYREWEVALLQVLSSGDDKEAIETQIGRVDKLFRRTLVIPLQNVEMVYSEYQDFLSVSRDKPLPDAHLQQKYGWTLQKLETINRFEDVITDVDTKDRNFDLYRPYLEQERKWSDQWRIIQLFDRIVADCPVEVEAWVQYTIYVDGLRIPEQSMTVHERAIKNVPWVMSLWKDYILAVERVNKPLTDLEAVFNRALANGYASSDEGVGLWLTYIYSTKRYVDKENKVRVGTEVDYEKLLKLFELGAENLKSNLGDFRWDPKHLYRLPWARMLGRVGQTGRMREILAELVTGGRGADRDTWLKVIALERQFGTVDQTRKLFVKAVNSVVQYGMDIQQAFVQFEREEGTLEDLDDALRRVEAQRSRHAERDSRRHAKQQEFEQAQIEEKRAKAEKLAAKAERRRKWEEAHPEEKGRKESGPPHKQKRSPGKKNVEIEEEEKIPENTEKVDPGNQETVIPVKMESDNLDAGPKIADIPPSQESPKPEDQPNQSEPDTKKDNEGFAIPTLPSAKRPKPEPKPESEPNPDQSAKTGTPPEFLSKPDQPVQESSSKEAKFAPGRDESKRGRTAFVSNLNYTIREEDLRKTFSKVGKVADIRLAKKTEKINKGFAYIEMSTTNELAAALMLDREMLNGRPMFVSIYEEDQSKRPKHFETGMNKKKLFVSNIHKAATQAEITEIFNKFPGVNMIKLVTTKQGHSKGFAYVEFESEADASHALLKTDKMLVHEQEIQVAISNPPARRPEMGPMGHAPMGQAQRGPHLNTMKSRLLPPRSTMIPPVAQSAKAPPPKEPEGPQVESTQDPGSSGKDSVRLSNEKFRQMLFKK